MDPTMPSLDELWQAFDESVDSAAVNWNTLFTELDAPIPVYVIKPPSIL
jgi:hypothetical protein